MRKSAILKKIWKNAVICRQKRRNGQSLQVIIAQLNPTLRGWFEYFKHSQPRTFEPLDG
ncbi:MAG: group II intron reverse transcriptase/maturase, partial [Planctomycetes bacterium]|nr:group II intron reverse transcriptase/maturase [Planctomycetota bacterium]